MGKDMSRKNFDNLSLLRPDIGKPNRANEAHQARNAGRVGDVPSLGKVVERMVEDYGPGATFAMVLPIMAPMIVGGGGLGSVGHIDMSSHHAGAMFTDGHPGGVSGPETLTGLSSYGAIFLGNGVEQTIGSNDNKISPHDAHRHDGPRLSQMGSDGKMYPRVLTNPATGQETMLGDAIPPAVNVPDVTGVAPDYGRANWGGVEGGSLVDLPADINSMAVGVVLAREGKSIMDPSAADYTVMTMELDSSSRLPGKVLHGESGPEKTYLIVVQNHKTGKTTMLGDVRGGKFTSLSAENLKAGGSLVAVELVADNVQLGANGQPIAADFRDQHQDGTPGDVIFHQDVQEDNPKNYQITLFNPTDKRESHKLRARTGVVESSFSGAPLAMTATPEVGGSNGATGTETAPTAAVTEAPQIPVDILTAVDDHDARNKILPYCKVHPDLHDGPDSEKVLKMVPTIPELWKLIEAKVESGEIMKGGYGGSVVNQPDGSGGCMIVYLYKKATLPEIGLFFESTYDGSWVEVKFTGKK